MKINYESYSTKCLGNVCEIKNHDSFFAFFHLMQIDLEFLHLIVKTNFVCRRKEGERKS